MKESSKVRDFYDEFSKRVLVHDFRYINRRHEAVKKLCDRFVPTGAVVLEIGCGAGIITSHLAKNASRVFAVDISPKNIAIAREFVRSPSVRFDIVDVIEQPAKIDDHGPFDIAVLADVIEHIPKTKHRELFATIERVLGGGGRVVLSFPSPEIQDYMTKHQPDDVQIVDESIEVSDLLGATSLKLLYFAYCDIFGRNDYVHVVLSREREFSRRKAGRGAVDWLASRWRKYRWRFGNFGFLSRLKRKNLV